jgi:ParB family chromosome partitioning protein
MEGDDKNLSKEVTQIEKMDVACVQTNKILLMGVDGRDVERCKRAAKEFGALTPPVVGKLPGGSRVVLNGGCEFAALREMGAREMNAVAIDIRNEEDGAKISLLLASLRRNPDALCEGMLIQQALEAGDITQKQICSIIDKSAAWVSKRLALVTRLDPGVKEFVSRQLLDPGSAQEIARLPADKQYEFANNAVRDNLSKATIEKLISGFSVEECPDAVRRQIIGDPQGAAPRFSPKSPERYVPACLNLTKLQSGGITDHIAAFDVVMSVLCSSINGLWAETAAPYTKALSRILGDLKAMVGIVQTIVSPGKISPGKHGEVIHAN